MRYACSSDSMCLEADWISYNAVQFAAKDATKGRASLLELLSPRVPERVSELQRVNDFDVLRVARDETVQKRLSGEGDDYVESGDGRPT